MSRIGKLPIALPKGVSVSIKDRLVEVKGPKGTLSYELPEGISVAVEGEEIVVRRSSDQRQQRAYHGLARAQLNNMVTGVSAGFTRALEIAGVGYRVEAKGDRQLVFHMGYSHPVEVNLPEGVSAKVEGKGNKLQITGIDKQVVGQIAANIRAIRPPEPYKGKGIKLAEEVIRRKAGKSGAA